MKNKKIKPLLFNSYLAAIKNSVNTKIFKNFYTEINGRELDIMENGGLSCAFFVSSILTIFGLIKKIHGTVDGVVADLKKSSWKKIAKPKIGSVLVWQEKMFADGPHKHIGFYVGHNQAVSNSHKLKTPIIHYWTFGRKNSKTYRQVEAIYWHKKLT